MQKNRRLGALAMAVAGILGSVQSAKAETFIWQGDSNDAANAGSGSWSSGSFWNTGRYPASNPDFPDYTARASTEIRFGGSDVNGPYTSWHDVEFNGAPVQANILRFNSTATTGTSTITQVNPDSGSVSNGSLQFVLNGTTTPRLIQDGSGAFNVDVPVDFSVNTIFSGSGTGLVSLRNTLTGTGALDIQGGNTLITGTARIGAAPSITFGNSGGGGILTLDGGSTTDRLVDTATVTFNAGGGTLAVGGASGAAAETVGTVTVAAGANRLQSNGNSTFTITSFTRNGGVMDFASTGGTLGGSAGGPRILIGSGPAVVNGILGGWATVNGNDFATYGANGVAAFTGYTVLPAAGFSATTNYITSGALTLTGSGDVYTVKLNAATANQTLNIGSQTLNVAGGILKTGTNVSTINGTGSFGGGAGAAELILTVSAGTLNFNAPFGAQNWSKAGTGGLNLTLASSPVWQTASFAGPVGLNVTADSTVSAQLNGSGSIVKTGNGKLTLTNAANGFSGGTTINGGTVELAATTASPNINLAGASSYLGTTGTININNGAVLKVTSNKTATAEGNINLTRAVTFGSGGGVLDLNNTVGGTLGGGTGVYNGVTIGGGNSGFALTSNATGIDSATIRFNGGSVGFSDPSIATNGTPNWANWNSGGNVLRITSYSGTGAVRIELTKAGTYRQGTGGGGTVTIPMPMTIAGEVGGNPTSGPLGTVNTSTSTTTGHIATDNFNVVNYAQGLTLQGSLQMSTQGAARAVAGNIVLSGLASGNPAFVAFNGRGTGTAIGPVINAPNGNAAGQNPLWLNYNGTNAAGTLTIGDGAIAAMDLRIRTDQGNSSGVFMEGATIIQSGGTLRFTQSLNNGTAVGYDRVNNDITGQGTTAKESTVDLYLPGANTNAANLRLNGVLFTDAAGLVVQGSGLGGLRVNGLDRPTATLNGTGIADVTGAVKIANLLTQSRLAGLTGTGGFLTIAPQSGTFTLPAGSEWAAAVPVGLRAGGGTVALPAGAWAHNLHVDAGAELGVSGVTVNNGTTPTVVSGLGALGAAAGVTFGTGTTVAPGAAGVAGTLSVNGSATLNAGSTLRSEVTGATNGTLAATGNLTITGSTLQFVPNTVTAGAHRWDVATGTIVGKFASAPLPADETTGSQRMWSLIYEPAKVSVGFTIGGDADFSGLVNFDDLLALAKAYNKVDQYWTNGEFTRDGLVNFDDLLVLAKNYNKVAAGAVPSAIPGATAEFNADVASAFAQAAVPEPGTLGLIGIGLMGALGGRRRRRQA